FTSAAPSPRPGMLGKSPGRRPSSGKRSPRRAKPARLARRGPRSHRPQPLSSPLRGSAPRRAFFFFRTTFMTKTTRPLAELQADFVRVGALLQQAREDVETLRRLSMAEAQAE